mgnify:CR=1 FL=1
MSSLLNKTRRLNKILQTGGADPVVFDDICKLLSEVLSCNVYIISRKGKVLGHTFSKDFECGIMKKYVLEECRFPKGYRERMGTLLLARFGEEFTDDDLVLAEHSTTIVGMEMLRAKQDELEDDARKKAVVQLAIGTLSYSELEAVDHIFNELDGNEGLLVASKIADKVGITRSVIVNALRKFESAGVIESRSLGMKGTHIKILNEKLVDELKKIR